MWHDVAVHGALTPARPRSTVRFPVAHPWSRVRVALCRTTSLNAVRDDLPHLAGEQEPETDPERKRPPHTRRDGSFPGFGRSLSYLARYWRRVSGLQNRFYPGVPATARAVNGAALSGSTRRIREFCVEVDNVYLSRLTDARE